MHVHVHVYVLLDPFGMIVVVIAQHECNMLYMYIALEQHNALGHYGNKLC